MKMNENLVIELSKKTDACFAYTDRNQSYFQIHCKNNKLTDGLWKDNINFIKNIFIYDIKTKHKIFPACFDKILYKPHEVELIYKSFSLKISLIIQKFQENLKNQQESDFPILRFSFSSLDKDASYSFGMILASEYDSYFYDDFGNLLDKSFSNKNRKIIFEKSFIENNFDKNIYCCFEKVKDSENKDFAKLFSNHLNGIETFFNNFTVAGLGNLTKSTYWALFSGWLLVTGNKHRGIWAGLPWFRDNWGRDTFIALPGILLVSGQFDEAKAVISSFAEFQDKNPSSPTYGRIPNRYIDENDVIFNTADGTLWFVREVWEYLQYTGDFDFLNSMWHVIKLALEVDIKNRTDEFGFLLHGDADTWMDARIKGQEPFSPRGSRGNDIQILWFTALKIAEKMAKLQKECEYEKLFANQSEKVKQNFIKFFLMKDKNQIGDCLGKNEVLDSAIRPNTFFTFSVPKILEEKEGKIFSFEDKQKIVKNTFEELVLEYGILSLSQNHIDFHPFHDKSKKYHKDAAYHNGTIWVWNSGPVIDSMCDVNQQNAAYELSSFHSKQMLDFTDSKTFGSRCAGSLSENINAQKLNGKIYPSGTWSQAWSVSEFARNVFQSYLGIKPGLLENKLLFSPKFPSVFENGEVDFCLGNNSCKISWKKKNDLESSKDYKKLKVAFYDFAFELKHEQNLTLEVEGIFENDKIQCEVERREFKLSKTCNLQLGILFDCEDFNFISEISYTNKTKPLSIKKKDYLTKKILSKSDKGFYTPVR